MTLGEHIRKVRMDKQLLQEDVAKLFKVSLDCITGWENGRSEPRISYYRRIIAFLGYYPFNSEVSGIPRQMLIYRKINGLTQKQLAEKVGVNASTITHWERSEHRPKGQVLAKLIKIIDENM